jgi:hypothetical protein
MVSPEGWIKILTEKYISVSVPLNGARKNLDSCRLAAGKVYPPNPNGSSGNALGKKLTI